MIEHDKQFPLKKCKKKKKKKRIKLMILLINFPMSDMNVDKIPIFNFICNGYELCAYIVNTREFWKQYNLSKFGFWVTVKYLF